MSAPLRLGVLISGGGTTLKNLLTHIDAGTLPATVATVVSSTGQAKGLQFARERNIPWQVAVRAKFKTLEEFSEAIFAPCRAAQVELVAMGGFLKQVKIPVDFVGRVLNIHPSLIPNFCGPGMYGHFVHEAVLAAGAKESGCTVHFVDDEYDHGPLVLQRRVPVLPGDTPDQLAARVFAAECEVYPEAIRLYAAGRLRVGVGGQVEILDANR